VTTHGALPDEHEQRQYDAWASAWNDYAGRILELEIHGYARYHEEALSYGRRWACGLSRDVEQITVTIERAD